MTPIQMAATLVLKQAGFEALTIANLLSVTVDSVRKFIGTAQERTR